MINAFLMFNKLIEESTEIKLELHYISIDMLVPGIVSMVFSMVTIVIGLGWNHLNISLKKGSLFATGNSIIIYTFSLLAWLLVVITLAEFSFGIITLSYLIGMVTINGSQEKGNYPCNPFFFGFISVLFPIVTLPSAQEEKYLVIESNHSGLEGTPFNSSNQASTMSQNSLETGSVPVEENGPDTILSDSEDQEQDPIAAGFTSPKKIERETGKQFLGC
jgi:hypothetical protein